MSTKSADNPFEAAAAFKEQVRRHCEQTLTGNFAGSPSRLSVHDHNPSFNEMRRSSDGQLSSMAGGKKRDAFVEPPSAVQKNHYLKSVTSEIRRSSDGLLQPPTFANKIPFAGPPITALMIPKHIQQQERRDDEVQVSQTEFRVNLDVSAYAPEELDVRIVGDDVVIRGRHAEGSPGENANITQQFSRRYTLPEDVLVDSVSVLLTKTGQMRVTASRKGVQEEKPASEKKVKFQE